VITGPSTVTTNAAVIVNGIVFDNTNSYTIAGTGSVTLDVNISSPSVFVLQGSHGFTVDVNLSDATNVSVASGSSLDFNNTVNLNGNTLPKTDAGTMNLNGTVNTGGGSVVVNEGVVGGTGTISGNLSNSGGTVAPGNSPGTLSVTGDYLQTDGSLLIEIDGATTPGTDYDVLNVTGDLTISGGTLDVVLGAFSPVVGNTFDILNFGTINLSGATLNLGTLGAGLFWDSSQLTVDGTLSVVSTVNFAWSVDNGGDWSTTSNWGGIVSPDGNNIGVLFGAAITAPHTVFTQGERI